ncbi:MAG: glycoside hydrolase family 16 protein [Amphiplicatus sp.]
MRPVGGLLAALFALAGAASASGAGADIDLSQYELSFSEDFNKLDVSGRRCDSRWIAHTPWNGDFGGAIFADPSHGFPFRAQRGVLRIEAKNEPGTGWVSGLLSARNMCNEGFAQRYGYFEARMMLPEGAGMWPAFWLIGVETDSSIAEIDVMEHHGHMPDKFTWALHVHAKTADAQHFNDGGPVTTAPGALTEKFNTFGVSIEEDETIFYFNRREIWRGPTHDAFKQPLYPLVNLAMDEGFVTEETPKRAFLYIDYVRAWRKKR